MRQDESGGGEWDWTPFAYYNMEEVGDGGYRWRLGCMDWVADIDGGTFTGYRWWLWEKTYYLKWGTNRFRNGGIVCPLATDNLPFLVPKITRNQTICFQWQVKVRLPKSYDILSELDILRTPQQNETVNGILALNKIILIPGLQITVGDM